MFSVLCFSNFFNIFFQFENRKIHTKVKRQNWINNMHVTYITRESSICPWTDFSLVSYIFGPVQMGYLYRVGRRRPDTPPWGGICTKRWLQSVQMCPPHIYLYRAGPPPSINVTTFMPEGDEARYKCRSPLLHRRADFLHAHPHPSYAPRHYLSNSPTNHSISLTLI